MAGERVDAADLGPLGLPGDRDLYVVDGDGRIRDARSRPLLLLHRATRGDDGRVRVDGLDWEEPAVAERVRAAAGAGARLVRAQEAERFDAMPLLVTTDGAIAALDVDYRRLRPNLVIAGVEGLAERGWGGRYLRAGSAVIGLSKLRDRCIMTTFDPDTAAQDVGVLLRIQSEFDGSFALDAWVARSGRAAVGDPVTLLDGFDAPEEAKLGRYARE